MIMQDYETPIAATFKRIPWNKGKLTGAKPPLRPKHVWSIRTKLQMADRKRNLALFNLAIDSKLRGCDVVALKVEDIAPQGYAIERVTVRQDLAKGSRPSRSIRQSSRPTPRFRPGILRSSVIDGALPRHASPFRQLHRILISSQAWPRPQRLITPCSTRSRL